MSEYSNFDFLLLDDFNWNLYSLYRCAISYDKSIEEKDRLTEEILHEYIVRGAINIIIDEDDW